MENDMQANELETIYDDQSKALESMSDAFADIAAELRRIAEMPNTTREDSDA